MVLFNEWLVFSLILFAIWLVIFIFRRGLRKEMFLVSLFTMPFGLTEPLFVPEYWNPPSLFNLAAKTGFDIESLIFSFAIGGIASAIYGSIYKIKYEKMSRHEKHSKKHRYHLIFLFSPAIVFFILWLFTELNPIYSASIAMFIGGLAAATCRPDLKKKTLIGGFLFLVLYFFFFLFFNIVYPGAVESFWNLSAISGILVIGVPLEELLFAFTLGMLWTNIYEHVLGYRIK
jgi:hypothetical protein